MQTNTVQKATIIDGKSFAKQAREDIKAAVTKLTNAYAVRPGLAVIIVGNHPASQVYVKNKHKFALEVGMRSFENKLPEDTTESALLAKIQDLNILKEVSGILVQLPLPSHIRETEVINAIAPNKDVDGFHLLNTGLLHTGQSGLTPCTPLGCLLLLKDTLGSLSGKHAVIIGRSNIVGKPMAQLLLKEDCTVTIAHSKTKHLQAICQQADIVVAAVGKKEMVKADWIKPGATVIDVGINRDEYDDGRPKLIGDVAFDEVSKVAGAITPVPGGVGPMTIACLLHNTLAACCQQHNISLLDISAK